MYPKIIFFQINEITKSKNNYSIINEYKLYKSYFCNKLYIYYLGIWADEEGNDSDDEPSGFGGRRKKDKKYKQNYTAPVSFVAGGVQQAGKEKKEILTEEKKDKESYNLEDNISASRFER